MFYHECISSSGNTFQKSCQGERHYNGQPIVSKSTLKTVYDLTLIFLSNKSYHWKYSCGIELTPECYD